jgi:predicted anti-sigma-YlaC factor YlaD
MMTCKEASRLVSESLDRRLHLAERIGLRVHLLICEACTRFSEQARFLRRAIRRVAGDERTLPEVRLTVAARQRIARALKRK